MTYQEQCTKYFAPLDEIAAAIMNGEGTAGLTLEEILSVISINKTLDADLCKYCFC